LRLSDIFAVAKVILYSPLTDRIAITLGRSPNITAKQYHSPMANITEKTLVQKEQEFFLSFVSEKELGENRGFS